jgi:transposase-like protein
MGRHRAGDRIPVESDGLQVNFCKNPVCPNYGQPASTEKQPRGKLSEPRQDTYRLSSDGANKLRMQCLRCNDKPPVKSNLAIREEIERMADYLRPSDDPSCPNIHCDNRLVGISIPKAYYSFGKTKSGSQRYRCRLCNTTFAVAQKSTFRQKRIDINELVFKLLMNKMPLKRICETAGISMDTLYRKIDFIHGRCLAFAAANERRLPQMPIRRLYLSVDRQDYIINWIQAGDKRNIQLTALGSADNKTNYVFGIHVNYDAKVDAATIETDAGRIGDSDLAPPFRRHARVWLARDYSDSLNRNQAKRSKRKRLRDDIEAGYAEAVSREDVEDPGIQTIETALPYKGMLVHSDYTLYGHFFFLRQLLASTEKIRFYMDQESGIRAACLSAFWVEVLAKRCDAFFVKVNKDLTINQKRRLKAQSLRDLADFRATSAAYEPLRDYQLRHIVMRQRIRDLVDIGKWHDRWLFYPFPDMSEPEKAVCWLTNLYDRAYDDDHLASLYMKATLHGIDRFFMQVRRRISLLERPIATASNEGRKWYGYSPYNPAIVGKMLDIFRVFYNYVEVGEDKKTPAMRLGLSEGCVKLSEVLNASVNTHNSFR